MPYNKPDTEHIERERARADLFQGIDFDPDEVFDEIVAEDPELQATLLENEARMLRLESYAKDRADKRAEEHPLDYINIPGLSESIIVYGIDQADEIHLEVPPFRSAPVVAPRSPFLDWLTPLSVLVGSTIIAAAILWHPHVSPHMLVDRLAQPTVSVSVGTDGASNLKPDVKPEVPSEPDAEPGEPSLKPADAVTPPPAVQQQPPPNPEDTSTTKPIQGTDILVKVTKKRNPGVPPKETPDPGPDGPPVVPDGPTAADTPPVRPERSPPKSAPELKTEEEEEDAVCPWQQKAESKVLATDRAIEEPKGECFVIHTDVMRSKFGGPETGTSK
jgi:hypothetical protein